MGGEWRVHSCSSESPVHKADNVLVEELYRIWQTHEPSQEAWLILQADPPMPFEKLELVNAGSSLLELYGLLEKENEEEGGDGEEELLLSTQQVMTLKDLTNKSNRNRTFTYASPQKLSPLAAQKRWKQLRIVCRQPFGTSEHRACIGLSRINVISCNSEARSSQSIVKTSIPEEVKQACSTDKSTKGIGGDASVNCNMNTLLMNDKDSKGDIKKRKLPTWDVKTGNSADYSPKNTVGDKGLNEEKKPKRISEGSEGNGKVSTNEHTGKAVNIESKGDILVRGDSKMNSLSSPKSITQQKKQKTASSGKDPANDVAVASPSNTFILSTSSAEGEGTSQSKSKPNIRSFGTLLDGVVFAISGLVNPERGNLRSQALEMGAEYEPDWNPRCTILVCAFPNTPKYKQVKDDGGTIVSKEWITECYKQKKLVDIDCYLMHAGKPWRKLQTSNISPVRGKQSKQMGKDLEQTERKIERELEQTKKKLHLGGRTVSARTNNNTKNMDAKSCEELDFNTSEMRQWVVEDINATVSWLQEQEEKPKPSELKEIAIQGIEACLEDTTKCLEEKKSVHTVLDNWGFIPRVVKEITALEDSRKGSQTISKDELCKRAHAFRKFYEVEFENLRKVIQQNKRKDLAGSDNQSLEALDRNKEVDVSNRDADSDDTIVMDEDELDEAEAEVSKNYSRT